MERRRPILATFTGGLSGPAIKPLALRIVAGRQQGPHSGDRIGGIGTVDDVMEFLVAGASAVQIGTANFYDPTASMRIPTSCRRRLNELARRASARLSDAACLSP